MSARQTVSSPSLPALMAACVLAGGTLSAGSAFAQDAGGDGGDPLPCAASGTQDRGEPITETSNLACGRGSDAGEDDRGESFGNTAIGGQAHAVGGANTALGSYSSATGGFSVAIGFDTSATGSSSVALGSGALADRSRTISVGRQGWERQIVNVAAGTEGTDAVNLDQMNAGDAATLASANGYTDTRETAIRTDMAAGDAATLANANSYTDTREGAIRTDMAAGDVATLDAANTHADAGDVRTLASAMSYADAGDDRTMAAARSYTDAQVGGLETVMNARFRDVNVRLDQVTAMSAAFSSMAGNNAGAGTGASNRLVVGVGAYGGETALSVGYSRAISRRTAFNAGVSFTGGEVMSGGSFGFAW